MTLEGRCWLCRQTWDVSPQDAAKPHPVAPVQFGLDSMLLAMTFAAVVCGAFVIAPGAGAAIAVLGLPALIRTAILARRSRVAGEPLSTVAKTVTFLATMSFVVVLLLAMGIAFYATCWVGFWGGAMGHSVFVRPGLDGIGTGFFVGIGLGVLAAAATMWWILRRALKTNYRVPAWINWCGSLVSLASLVVFWAAWDFRADSIPMVVLPIAGCGFVFSALGLGTSRRWVVAWGVGLSVGTTLGVLLMVLDNSSQNSLSRIGVCFFATVLSVAIAIPLHLWTMRLRDS